MDIAVEELAGGVTKVVLRGRFDTTGAVVVELPFNKIVTEKNRIIVDLSAVNFLASYAIRVLLVGAKIVKGKGGKLVMLCPDNNVAKVLKTTGTDALIPIFQTQERRDGGARIVVSAMSSPDASRLVLRNDLAELERLRDGSKAGREQRAVSSDCRSPSLCLEEAVANIIMYGATEAEGLEIAVEVERNGGNLVARIEDNGRPIRSDPGSSTDRGGFARRRQNRRPRHPSDAQFCESACTTNGDDGRNRLTLRFIGSEATAMAPGCRPMTEAFVFGPFRLWPHTARAARPRCAGHPRSARVRRLARAREPSRPTRDQGRAHGRGLARGRSGREQSAGPRLRLAQSAGHGGRRRALSAHRRRAGLSLRGAGRTRERATEGTTQTTSDLATREWRQLPKSPPEQPPATADQIDRPRGRARRHQSPL